MANENDLLNLDPAPLSIQFPHPVVDPKFNFDVAPRQCFFTFQLTNTAGAKIRHVYKEKIWSPKFRSQRRSENKTAFQCLGNPTKITG